MVMTGGWFMIVIPTLLQIIQVIQNGEAILGLEAIVFGSAIYLETSHLRTRTLYTISETDQQDIRLFYLDLCSTLW